MINKTRRKCQLLAFVSLIGADRVVGGLGGRHAAAFIRPTPSSHSRGSLYRGHGEDRGGGCFVVDRDVRAQLGVTSWADDLHTLYNDAQLIWNIYVYELEKYPLVTKALTAGLILPAGDLAAQVIERRKKKKLQKREEETQGYSDVDPPAVDYARALRFMIFGLVLQAPVNHFWFQLLDNWFPSPDNPLSITNAEKLIVDQLEVRPPFLAAFFVLLGLLEGKNIDDVKKRLQKDLWPTTLTNWKLWVPAGGINLAFVPLEFRVLYSNVIWFFWAIYLSTVANSRDDQQSQPQPQQQQQQ